MSDIIKHSKKVLSATLTVSTIVWAVGLFALAPVEVGARAGDLVKSAGDPAVYLVDDDGVTIHPFPHANVYESWGYPQDFGTVLTTDISGFTVGNDVEFRDGSLVRSLEDPAVYVVSGKTLRPINSAEVFEALGYDYDNITWLPQSFLDEYGDTGEMVESTTTHSDGALVKYATSSTVYLIEDGQKRAFSSNDVIASNNYDRTPVITIPSSETYSDGANIVVTEENLMVPTGVGSAPAGDEEEEEETVVGSGLEVSLASDSPATATIIGDTTTNVGQQLVPFLKLNFTAGSDGAVTVTTITVQRTGISSDSDIDGLYLYEGDSISPADQLTDSTAVSSGSATFNKSTGLFTVSAGETKSVMVRGDVAYNVSAGKTIGLTLESASDVTTDGATVSGSFSMAGNRMSTAAVTNIGKLLFSSYNTPSSANTDIDPEEDQQIWKATFDGANQELNIEHLRFTVVGSVETDDLENFVLRKSGNTIATVDSMSTNYEIDFDMSDDPLVMDKGQSATLELRADIVDGATRDFYVSFQNAVDVVAKDTGYGVYIQPYTSGTFSIIKPSSTNDWNITQGSLSVSRATESPTEDVAVDQNNVVWGIWDFKASGEDIKIKNLDVNANDESDDGGLDSGQVQYKHEGDSVWTTVGTTKDLTDETDVNFTFGSTLVIPAGTTTKIRVIANAKQANGTSLTGDSSVTVTLGTGSSNAQRQDSLGTFNVPGSDKAGNSITVSSASLDASKYSGFGDQTVVAGTNGVRVGSFVLQAGASSDVDVSSITVELASNEASTVSNMYLQDNSTAGQIGTTKGNPSASNAISTSFTLDASGTKTIDIYADIDSGADSADWIADVSASGSDEQGNAVSASSTSLQTITVGTGNLYLNNGSHPSSDILVAGSSDASVGQFTFSASNEAFTVSKLKLKTENNFASTTAAVKLTYTDSNNEEVTASETFISATDKAYSTATFTGLDIYVPADEDRNVEVTLDTVLLSSNGSSGANGAIYVDYDEGYKQTGESGTTSTSIGSTDKNGKTFYVHKSKPTFTRGTVTGDPTSSTALYQFDVVADAAGNIEFKELGFTFTTSGVTVTQIRLYDTDDAEYITDSTSNTVDSSGDIDLFVGAGNDDDVEIIGTTAHTYEVRGTVSGWGDSADSLTVSFTKDTSAASNDNAEAISDSNNITWSDKSASNHSTTSTDWTNGYLLNDLDESQSF